MPVLRPTVLMLAAAGLGAPPALALEVRQSVEVAAAPEQVWQAIGDFCSIAEWHPAIARCAAGKQNGAPLRTLTTVDGAVLVERRVQHSEEGMSYSYQIVESSLPVADYEATLAVMDSAGGSTITWSGAFAAAGTPDAEARAIIEALYAAGLAALKERLR